MVKLLTLLLMTASPALCQAQAQPWSYTLSAGVQHRHLEERTGLGMTLLTEAGPMVQLILQGERRLEGSDAVGARLILAGGNLAYEGQTQAGAPLSTRTRQTEAGLDLLWRPIAPGTWGEAWLSAGALINRRSIRATVAAGGLDESTGTGLVGIMWRTPPLGELGGWDVRAELDARVSFFHRIHVDYQGVLDASTIKGPRRTQLAVRVIGSMPGSPWHWGVEWSGQSQSMSGAVPVTRGGAPFGIVRQPELGYQDVVLRLGRKF